MTGSRRKALNRSCTVNHLVRDLITSIPGYAHVCSQKKKNHDYFILNTPSVSTRRVRCNTVVARTSFEEAKSPIYEHFHSNSPNKFRINSRSITRDNWKTGPLRHSKSKSIICLVEDQFPVQPPKPRKVNRSISNGTVKGEHGTVMRRIEIPEYVYFHVSPLCEHFLIGIYPIDLELYTPIIVVINLLESVRSKSQRGGK